MPSPYKAPPQNATRTIGISFEDMEPWTKDVRSEVFIKAEQSVESPFETIVTLGGDTVESFRWIPTCDVSSRRLRFRSMVKLTLKRLADWR